MSYDEATEKMVLERLKNAKVNIAADIAHEEANTYSAEIAEEIGQADKQIREKYAKKKAERLAELKSIERGIDYTIKLEATAIAENSVSNAEAKRVT